MVLCETTRVLFKSSGNNNRPRGVPEVVLREVANYWWMSLFLNKYAHADIVTLTSLSNLGH